MRQKRFLCGVAWRPEHDLPAVFRPGGARNVRRIGCMLRGGPVPSEPGGPKGANFYEFLIDVFLMEAFDQQNLDYSTGNLRI